MIITPDLSEAVETTSEPIPPGTYSCRIEDVELKKTKAGADMLKWKMKIFGADGELARYNNWPIFYNTMTSGKGAGMLKALYKAATREDLGANFDTDAILGKEVQVVTANGRNQDGTISTWPEVRAVKPLN